MLRHAESDRIYSGLLSMQQGLAVMDPDLAASAPILRNPPAGPAPALTPREMQALQLLAEGLPNKTIAGRLGISENTVKFHVNGVLGKLNAQSRAEAVAQGARMGLILL